MPVHDVYDLLAARGVSRRDFLKYCGSIASTLGLAEMYAPQIAAALQSAAKLKPAIWLDMGLCTGCTESTAQVGNPNVADIVLDLLSINYMETISAAAGAQAEEAKAKTIEEGGYILIVEGTVMTGEGGNTLRIAEKTGMEILKEAASKAAAIVCVGSCAVDGGWVAAAPNPAGGKGVMEVAVELGFDKVPIINLPTCPVNPDWIVAVVVDVLLLEKLPDLDDKGRPKLIFGSTIHDNCSRRGHFENGEFVEKFGSLEEKKQWCLYKVGCKGPETFTNCPLVRWNRKASWCVESGSPCIGCGNVDPTGAGGNWVDTCAPFLRRSTAVGTGIGGSGLKPETIGTVLAAGAAGAFALYGVAETARGRLRQPSDAESPVSEDSERGQ
jgi:hydrogenase small subunit